MAGLIKKLIASGVAARVIQEARKPQNQAKIKQLASKLGRGTRPRPDATR